MNNKEVSQPENIHVYRKKPRTFLVNFLKTYIYIEKGLHFWVISNCTIYKWFSKKPVHNIDWYFSTPHSVLLHVSKKKRKKQDAIILKKDNWSFLLSSLSYLSFFLSFKYEMLNWILKTCFVHKWFKISSKKINLYS